MDRWQHLVDMEGNVITLETFKILIFSFKGYSLESLGSNFPWWVCVPKVKELSWTCSWSKRLSVGDAQNCQWYFRAQGKTDVYVYIVGASDFWLLMLIHRSHLDDTAAPVLHYILQLSMNKPCSINDKAELERKPHINSFFHQISFGSV